ncbi:MAG: hypothetical protein SAJ12_10490 [Jaaginema sp. PMC 1079.18]|nr:hypothetical protein [Jaaginema sp. PMC 1080.18]MEC4851429.1 hypothetical protein [Jaaginema sp. PMC 1079.18]MEC4866101.1 hypothetical protein [Jaaginema sp. PMC 1078.18]
METSEFVVELILAAIAIGTVLIKIGQTSSLTDYKVNQFKGEFLTIIADLRSEIMLKFKDVENGQNLDCHKLEDQERQLKDLHVHLKDVERKLEKEQGFARKPYIAFEDTQARQRKSDGTWVE